MAAEKIIADYILTLLENNMTITVCKLQKNCKDTCFLVSVSTQIIALLLQPKTG